jgi:hypothetical protein
MQHTKSEQVKLDAAHREWQSITESWQFEEVKRTVAYDI